MHSSQLQNIEKLSFRISGRYTTFVVSQIHMMARWKHALRGQHVHAQEIYRTQNALLFATRR
jgi:hypothetical protein